MSIPQFDDFFGQMFISCALLGLPFGESSIHLRFYIFLLVEIVMVTGEICFCISKISSSQFLELTKLAPCVSVGILSILKIICVAVKWKKINQLVRCLRNLYEDLVNDSKKQDVARKDLSFLYSLIKVYFLLNTLLIVIYNFSTVFIMLYRYLSKYEVVFMLPYALLLPFATDSWFSWSLVYFYSIISGFLCVLFYTTVDVLYYILSSHVCNHFTLIAYELEYLTDASDLRGIITKHQYLLKLSGDLEDIFTAPNFFNVLVGSLEICALGFDLTIGGGTRVPGIILFLTSVLTQTYMMCLFGETLIRTSARVGEAAYLCKWHNMGKTSKRLILIILIRSNKEQHLTALNFSIISYKCFTKIISTSWSYFTILRTFCTDKYVMGNSEDTI